MASEEQVQAVLAEIRKGPAQYDYFFDNVSEAGWIKPLARHGVFLVAPDPIVSDAGVRIPGWSASRYLARVAAEAPDDVLEVALAIKTDNERVHIDLAEAATAMPGQQARQWAEHEIQWLKKNRYLRVLLDNALADLVTHLVATGEVDAAFSLAEELVRVYRPEQTDHHRFAARREVGTRTPDWEYHRLLGKLVPTLVSTEPERALAALVSVADRALSWIFDEDDGGSLDASQIWRARIDDDQRASADAAHALVSAVRDAARLALREQLVSARRLVDLLGSARSPVMGRVVLEVLASAGLSDSEVLEPLLLHEESFAASTPSPEYRSLLTAGYPRLSARAQETILEWINRGPADIDLNRVRNRLAAATDPEREVEAYSIRWKLRRLNLIADFVDEEWQARRATWTAHAGPAVFQGAVSVGIWSGDRSPFSVDELSTMSDDELFQRISSWRPADAWGGPSADGLGHALSELAQREPTRISRLAGRLRSLDTTYVQWLLSGLTQATRAGAAITWDPVVDLLEWVVAQPGEVGRAEWGESSRDAVTTWARKEAASLLSAGFESKDAAIPHSLRTRVWAVIAALAEDPDPTPEHEATYGGSNMDPATLSLNTTRGQALHAAIRYGLWILRAADPPKDSGSLADCSELRELLTRHLDAEQDPALSVRAVYGQWFPWLVLLDEAWASAAAPRVFERADANRWGAAWDAYISLNRPYDDVVSVLEEEYAYAISRLRETDATTTTATTTESPAERLAAHLMALYWRGADFIDVSGLVSMFFASATPPARKYALEFIGRGLTDSDQVDSAAVPRLVELWESRARVVLHEGDTTNAEELEAFGWWFSAGTLDPEWRLDQAKSVLEAGLRLDATFLVFKALPPLAAAHPAKTSAVLRLLLASEAETWTIEAHRGEIAETLGSLLSSSDRDVRESAVATAHWLGAHGYRQFRDLLRERD